MSEQPFPFVSADKKAAAAAVGLSDKTLDEAVRAGDLIAHYFGTKPVFLAADLAAWIESLPTERPDRRRVA